MAVETNWIDCDVDVRQGCVLSSTLLLLSAFDDRLINGGIGNKLEKVSIPRLFLSMIWF